MLVPWRVLLTCSVEQRMVGKRDFEAVFFSPLCIHQVQLLHELCPNAPVLKSSRMLTRRPGLGCLFQTSDVMIVFRCGPGDCNILYKDSAEEGASREEQL